MTAVAAAASIPRVALQASSDPAEPYPELEDIPEAPPRRSTFSGNTSSSSSSPKDKRKAPTSSFFPIPLWASKVFSSFPLHSWEAARVISPPLTLPPIKPRLYVAPPLTRTSPLLPPTKTASSTPSPLSTTGQAERKGWASSDPTCLRWQIEFLFRGVDFDVEFIHPNDSWGPGGGVLPFLHLPPSFQPPTLIGARSSSTFGPSSKGSIPSVLGGPELAHFLENHYPLDRPELDGQGGKAHESGGSQGWRDRLEEVESRSWSNLLEGRVMAAVLLANLLSSPQTEGEETSDGQKRRPYLSSVLASRMQTTHLDRELARISVLSGQGAKEATSRLPGWEVGLLGWIGAVSSSNLGGGGGGAAGGIGEEEGEDRSLLFGFGGASAAGVEEALVVERGVSGIRAVLDRMEEYLRLPSSSPSASSLPSSTTSGWMLGCRRPSALDALLFSIVHTVMTLSAASRVEENEEEEPVLKSLREAIEAKEGLLVEWSRRVWRQFVKPREAAT
ncbi:hypothetical protein IE53DRAFT_311501 [Violaceomyces palustris]|uniref:Uncharacterized protein n=1 Tax=Violaceomyces palustris TaxID=1673888 RepID=A0ACD0P3V8_9BASI|nr:hypothetical protein IE53DRAFT_311501 [Violaceomyces palustris]